MMYNAPDLKPQYPVGWPVDVTDGQRRGRRGIKQAITSSYWVKFDVHDRDGISFKRVWKVNVKILSR